MATLCADELPLHSAEESTLAGMGVINTVINEKTLGKNFSGTAGVSINAAT